jgi:hypothetical protein
MRLVLLFLAAFVLLSIQTYAQDHYNPAKALSSEELFLKKTGTNRIISQPGQKYLAFDTSPWIGGFHRYRFFPGDNMRFRMKNETIRFNETIASIADSSFTIGVVNEAASRMDYQSIPLKEIRLMKVQRNIPFVTQAAPLLPLAGLIFIAADFFNKGTDNKRFTTDTSALMIGGTFMVTGFICYKLSFSSLKINNKIKVLETY